MSLALKATRSAAWMFAGGMTAQMFGLVGTLVVVRFVSPAEYGEATVAALVVGTAAQFSAFGLGQFVVVKTRGRRDVAFHAMLFGIVLAAVAAALVLALGTTLGAFTHAPTMTRYLPWMAVSMMIDRLWFVPERTLAREMRFRAVALVRVAGELTYSVSSVVLAIVGLGGMAIIAGNVARSVVRGLLVLGAADRREWLAPCRPRLETVREILSFGTPLSLGGLGNYASRKWDNLLVSRFFGPAVMAAYNLAYGVAEVPCALVGEHVIDVILPSFTRIAGARDRERAFHRGAALMSLFTSPLAVGLGAVAPSVVAAFLDPRWAAVAPMLTVLSVISVVRPSAWITTAYLQARDQTSRAMWLDLFNVAAILVGVAALAPLGPIGACVGVGIGVSLRSLAGAAAIGTSVRRFIVGQVGPVIACAPMVAAVLAVRWSWHHAGVRQPSVGLALEVLAGGVVYVGAAFVLVGETARDALELAKRMLAARRARPEPALS